MNREMNLLDKLHTIIGCEYLSELKEQKFRSNLSGAVLRINITDFTLDEWSRTLSYILGTELSVRQYEDIDRYIQEHCK